MVSTRIGSLSLVNDTLRDVTASQERLSELQNQISSGFKSSTFAGLSGSVEQFTKVNAQIDRAAQYQISNQVNVSKLQTADVALGRITDIADQIKNTIVATTGAAAGTSNLPQIVGDLLEAFASELNATFNGEYIFGGSDTRTLPVPSSTVSTAAAGVPDDIYYVGSKQDVLIRADERVEITFPVRADNIAFQKIYAAARLAITAAADGDSSQLSDAQQLIQDGQKDLIAVRSRAASAVKNIQNVDDRFKQLQNHWQQLSDEVSKTDIVAASTQVASYQAILQASFQVYARLSQLRLGDYL